ncbi:MAG: AAA family ATPase, partial [Promethearchaeota archaeon]
MKITRIQFSNFMGYNSLRLPNAPDEELSDGLILISGRNSHGKSTILEGVIYAFFGAGAFKLKKASSFITYGESEAEIYVYFTMDNNKYYIYRKWSRSNSSIAFKLFRMNDTTGKYEEIKKFDIQEFFEITQAQALSTVFVKQGEIEELSSKKGATVRDMILKLFQLDIIDKTLDLLDKDKSRVEASKAKLQGELIPISRIEKEIEEFKTEIATNKDIIKQKVKIQSDKEGKLSKLPSQDLLLELNDLYISNSENKKKFLSYQDDFMEKVRGTEFKAEDPDLGQKIDVEIEKLGI